MSHSRPPTKEDDASSYAGGPDIEAGPTDEVGLHVNPGKKELRWPFNKLMDSKFGRSHWKNHVIAMIGEAIGTSSFLFFAFAGTEVAVYGKTSGEDANFDPASVLYISIAFGISLMVNVFIFFRISGGLFNPAVTLAMCLTKSIAPMRCLLLFVSQMLACMFSTYIVSVIIPQPLGVVTSLSNGATVAQGVCLEMILTAYLILTIFMLAGEKHKGTFMAPVGIGMSLFSAHLVAVQWTGCGINPARAFGPAVISGTWDDHWIYWIGPLAGSVLASGLYKFFKHMRYEEANPGQDADEMRRKSMSTSRNPFA